MVERRFKWWNIVSSGGTPFQGVEHRLEHVLKINKVQYINDSKATNVNATYFALESMDAPTVWIVGGVDKGNDYKELFQFVNEKVKAIICLGVDNKKLIETLFDKKNILMPVYFRINYPRR